MKTKTLYALDANGKPFESSIALGFWNKDILRYGKWFHPQTKKRINVTEDWLDNLCKNTNLYIQRGNKIPFPPAHRPPEGKTFTEINMGYWRGFDIRNGELQGVVEVPLEEHGKKISTTIQDVSAMIEFNKTDSQENTYDAVITHVSGTPFPVIHGQKNFQPLSHEPFNEEATVRFSDTDEEVTVYECIKEGDIDMELLKELGKELSLSEEDMTPEKVLETVKDIRDLAKKKTEEAVKPKEPKAKTEYELALEAKLKEHDEILSEERKRHNKILLSEADNIIEGLNITGKLGECLKKLLLSQNTSVKCLALDENEEIVTEENNVSKLAKEICNELKEGQKDMVPFDVISDDASRTAKGENAEKLAKEREFQLSMADDCKRKGQEVHWVDEKKPELGFSTTYKNIEVHPQSVT